MPGVCSGRRIESYFDLSGVGVFRAGEFLFHYRETEIFVELTGIKSYTRSKKEKAKEIDAKMIFSVCEKLFSIEENCVIDRQVIPESWWK